MYCVYNNFFLFNFFLINNFNNYNILIFLKTKNLFLNSFVNSNCLKNKNKKIMNSNFLLKYFKYFNKVMWINQDLFKKDKLIFHSKYKGYNFYVFNKYNYVFFKKLVNLFFDFIKESRNFLILDSNYRSITPIYNYIFNFKNVTLFSKYFFINSIFFTYRNWFFLYKNFINSFKIVFLFVIDFYYFRKFFKFLRVVNIPISSLIPANTPSLIVDYPLYVSFNYNLEKFIFLNMIANIFFLSLNYKNYINKIKYLQLFYNFSRNFF